MGLGFTEKPIKPITLILVVLGPIIFLVGQIIFSIGPIIFLYV